MVNNNKFFVSQDTERVDLGDDAWVDLKKEMSIGDHEKLESAMMQVDVVDDEYEGSNRAERRALARFRGKYEKETKEQKTKLKVTSGEVEILFINIVAWSFDVELTRANVSQLRESVTVPIIEKITELNAESPLVKRGLEALEQINSTKTP